MADEINKLPPDEVLDGYIPSGPLDSIDVDTKSQFDLPRPDGLTKEQRSRDSIITVLLSEYCVSYIDKNTRNKTFRTCIFWTCLGILIFFAFFLFGTINSMFLSDRKINYEGVAAVITVAVTFIGLVISILKIITTYVFPKDDEKHITDIVRAIQSNDLAHKKNDTEKEMIRNFRKRNNKDE